MNSMGIESTPKFENSEIRESLEHRKLRVNNEIQSLIMNTICGMDDAECHNQWLENYADSFGTIFREVLERDHNFLDKWDNDIQERNVTLDFFMEELRKLDGPIDKAA